MLEASAEYVGIGDPDLRGNPLFSPFRLFALLIDFYFGVDHCSRASLYQYFCTRTTTTFFDAH